jgi:maltose/maltodextrin transport system substrate-binding protein
MEQKMNAGDLAMMISGPWAWANLRKSRNDFVLAPVPGVDGKPGKPFVGVLAGLINRSTPDTDLAIQFLEKYVCTADGLKTIDYVQEEDDQESRVTRNPTEIRKLWPPAYPA